MDFFTQMPQFWYIIYNDRIEEGAIPMAHFLRKWMSAILAMLVLAGAMMPAALAESYSAYINSSTKIYKKASSSSASMSVKKGTKCEVTAISGKWARVTRSGVTAYIQVKYLTMNDRIKAYANCDTKVYKRASSSSSSTKIAVNTEVYIVGCSGNYWKVETKNGETTAYIKMSNVSWSKVKTEEPEEIPELNPEETPEETPDTEINWKDQVVKMDWYDGGSEVLDRGDYATIYHCKTGTTIRIKRMGGHHHADLEPATAEDTAKLLKMAGGKFSWDSRAVILHSEGKYVACAINTMPHGDQTISNNGYNGQFCLHMVDSRTHGSDTVNTAHQAAIKKAYNWAH